ncbi:hypothetical protein L3X38_041170 [Prunus dulcis]|uniref:Uncharacterized protein n=1 Tax=Prunus dulcis TaxID=3755 RepID=A0AAD4UU63_PRUDU|nr:hypothetical protein L3X38_041170 [Prunus dulcis]
MNQELVALITRMNQSAKDSSEGESPSLVVFRCGTPLALLRVVICGDASLAKFSGKTVGIIGSGRIGKARVEVLGILSKFRGVGCCVNSDHF